MLGPEELGKVSGVRGGVRAASGNAQSGASGEAVARGDAGMDESERGEGVARQGVAREHGSDRGVRGAEVIKGRGAGADA